MGSSWLAWGHGTSKRSVLGDWFDQFCLWYKQSSWYAVVWWYLLLFWECDVAMKVTMPLFYFFLFFFFFPSRIQHRFFCEQATSEPKNSGLPPKKSTIWRWEMSNLTYERICTMAMWVMNSQLCGTWSNVFFIVLQLWYIEQYIKWWFSTSSRYCLSRLSWKKIAYSPKTPENELSFSLLAGILLWEVNWKKGTMWGYPVPSQCRKRHQSPQCLSRAHDTNCGIWPRAEIHHRLQYQFTCL